MAVDQFSVTPPPPIITKYFSKGECINLILIVYETYYKESQKSDKQNVSGTGLAGHLW